MSFLGRVVLGPRAIIAAGEVVAKKVNGNDDRWAR